MSGIIVFGGSGFIGSHLLRKLVAQGGHSIYSVDIREPKIRVEGVNYIRGDVRDLGNLDIPDTIDMIFNLAAVHTTPGHPTHEYYETNIRGATEITAFARRRNIANIIFTSSISVYGPSEDTKTEQTPVAPESAYGWSKWLAEGIHRSWLEEDEARRLVICRPAVIFGYKEGGNFTRLASLLKKGFFIYPGRKDTIKGCFYVEDLVDALLYANGLGERYILFNGCYPDRYTIEQIVESFRADHFPKAKTYLVPYFVLVMIAKLLRPFSALGLGIHPERVMKLVRSTDILPGWLLEQGKAASGRLPSALERWKADSQGRFD